MRLLGQDSYDVHKVAEPEFSQSDGHSDNLSAFRLDARKRQTTSHCRDGVFKYVKTSSHDNEGHTFYAWIAIFRQIFTSPYGNVYPEPLPDRKHKPKAFSYTPADLTSKNA
ncbi:hypothetical protein CSKR_201272 [Clonorchis sinensis]|uniref:Uncharacterized protein n=1 Tax=Clonorchis sinensis TaxID=79923 RepID=A0A8T1MNX9_CLOSI|nr:hypothetical protein CSKR_201272 [Clonorchis sinensis]